MGMLKVAASEGAIVPVTPAALEARDIQRKCVDDIDNAYMLLGESCIDTANNRWYTQFGYETMEEYVSNELLYKPSTVRYYMQLARYRLEVGDIVSEDDWKQLGPTKSRILAQSKPDRAELPDIVERYKDSKVSTRDMMTDLIDKDTHDKLHDMTRRVKTGGDVTVRWKFSAEQWRAVWEVIDQVKTELGDPEASDARAIELVCESYRGGPEDNISIIEKCLFGLGLGKSSVFMTLETIKSLLEKK